MFFAAEPEKVTAEAKKLNNKVVIPHWRVCSTNGNRLVKPTKIPNLLKERINMKTAYGVILALIILLASCKGSTSTSHP